MVYIFDNLGSCKSITEEELDAVDDDGSYIIVLDHGISTDDGRAYWLYIAVKANKYKAFRSLVAQRIAVYFEEFGRILNYGYEKQVPVSVRHEMKEKYGVDDVYMQWLIQDCEKARQAFLKEKEVEDNKRITDIVAMLKKKNQS